MKAMYIAAVAALSVLGLAGCGHSAPPMHTLSYYEQHPKAAAKVVSYCTDHARELRDHPHRYARRVRNCDAAGTAQYDREFYGSPAAQKQPVVTTSGGTLNNTTRFLAGKP